MDTQITISTQPSLLEQAYDLLESQVDRSFRFYQSSIQEFFAFIRGTSYQPHVALSLWKSHLHNNVGNSKKTANKKLSHLRKFFECAVSVGMLDAEELQRIREIKGYKVRGGKARTWIGKKDMQALMDAPDRTMMVGRRDRAALAILIGCALRAGELIDFTWGNITRYEDVWAFTNVSRKAGRTQDYIPIPDWVMDVLEQYIPRDERNTEFPIILRVDRGGNLTESGVSYQTVYNIVSKYSKQIGIPLSPHDFRASTARTLRKAGVPIEQIQLLLGHQSPETTDRYINMPMDLPTLAEAFSLEV